MPQFIVVPSHDGQFRFEDLRSAAVVERDTAQRAAQTFYNHAIVIPCEVFPRRSRDEPPPDVQS